MEKIQNRNAHSRIIRRKDIECERLDIRDNCYCFWILVQGKSRLVASYPIHYTIVREIIEEN